MFGIIDENKKFILLDENRDKLRATALLLVKYVNENFVAMFDQNTVDDAIKEYLESEIDILQNADAYLKK